MATAAAKDVLKTIRSKNRSKMSEMDDTSMKEEAAARELKEEYEIRKRIQMGRIRDRLRRKMAKLKDTPSSDQTLADFVYSDSPGTSRYEGTISSMTINSHTIPDKTPSPIHRLETRSPVENEAERKERIRRRWQLHQNRHPAITSIIDQYRERLRAERESGLDLLETIRTLRGLSKKEFYDEIETNDGKIQQPKNDKRDDTIQKKEIEHKKKIKFKRKTQIDVFDDSSSVPILPKLFSQKIKNTDSILDQESDVEVLRALFKTPEQIKDIESKTATPERTVTATPEPEVNISVTIQNRDIDKGNSEEYKKDEKVPKVFGKKLQSVGYRIDSRWPEGHKFYTKPIDESDVLHRFRNKSHMSKTLRDSMAAILSIYRKDNCYAEWEKSGLALKNKRKAKFNEVFENWRTELMKIAYDEEFASSHNAEKRFSYPVLQNISDEAKYPLIKSSSVLQKLAVPKSIKDKKFVRKSKRLRDSDVTNFSKRTKDKLSENVEQNKESDQEKIKCSSKGRISYLPEFSSFIEPVGTRKKLNGHIRNTYAMDRVTASAERISPSTDSAINEPNSDFENDPDVPVYVKLPPISVQVKGMQKLQDTGGKTCDETEPVNLNNSVRSTQKGVARSQSLMRIKRILNKISACLFAKKRTKI